MICKDFQGLKLSQLGFGTMRLPLREDRSIDEEQAAAMTFDAAMQRRRLRRASITLTPRGRITAANRRQSSAKF